MQLNHLVYFLEVVNERSISKAAHKLHISQPSLSITIKNIEHELGQPLLKRTKYGVIPTAFGLQVFNDFNEFKQKMDAWYPQKNISNLPLNGSVYFNVMPSASDFFYKNIIFPFNEMHPDVKFYQSNAFLHSIINDLSNTPSNIAILSISKNLESQTLALVAKQGWHYKHIFTDKRVLAISTKHPFSDKELLQQPDLKELALVYYSYQNDTISEQYVDYFSTSYRVGSYNDILMFLLQGKAVWLPLQYISNLKHYVTKGLLKFYPIPVSSISDEVPVYVIFTNTLGKSEQAFLDYLIQYFNGFKNQLCNAAQQ